MKRIIVLFAVLLIAVIVFIERSNNSAEGMNDLMLENVLPAFIVWGTDVWFARLGMLRCICILKDAV